MKTAFPEDMFGLPAQEISRPPAAGKRRVTPTQPAAIAPGERSSRVPPWLKIIYTAFVAVLVPYYWHAYGPTNFLYFCDVALLMTLAALWTESALLASMPAVGILLPQAFWCADFLAGLAGWHPLGLTAYMFNPGLSMFTRGLSFFHFWLPFLLVWLVWRLGYDRRALLGWTLLAWGLMCVGYFCLPAPPAAAATPNLPVNVNYVFGFSDQHPQTWMAPGAFFGLMLLALPGLVFLPTHLLLRRVCRMPAARG